MPAELPPLPAVSAPPPPPPPPPAPVEEEDLPPPFPPPFTGDILPASAPAAELGYSYEVPPPHAGDSDSNSGVEGGGFTRRNGGDENGGAAPQPQFVPWVPEVVPEPVVAHHTDVELNDSLVNLLASMQTLKHSYGLDHGAPDETQLSFVAENLHPEMNSQLESTRISTLPQIAALHPSSAVGTYGDGETLALGNGAAAYASSSAYASEYGEELAQVARRDPRRSAGAQALVRRDGRGPTAMTQAFLSAPTPPPNEAPKMAMRGLLLMAHEDSPVTGEKPLDWTAVYMRLR